MGAVIWVHEDALTRDNPVFQQAGTGSKSVFVWDANYLQNQGHSFKKLVFIYECLQDMDVDIIEGDTVEILSAYCAAGSRLFFAEPRNPDLLNLIAPLRRSYNVTIIDRQPLGGVSVKPEMKRFFRYWNKARLSILKK